MCRKSIRGRESLRQIVLMTPDLLFLFRRRTKTDGHFRGWAGSATVANGSIGWLVRGHVLAGGVTHREWSVRLPLTCSVGRIANPSYPSAELLMNHQAAWPAWDRDLAGGASFTHYPDYPDLLFTRTWLIIGGILFSQDGILDRLPQKLGNFAEFGSPKPVGNPFPTGGIMKLWEGKEVEPRCP